MSQEKSRKSISSL